MTTPSTSPLYRVHAFTADALADHDAIGLANEIQRGRISAAEAVEAAIARAEKVNPLLNAIKTDCFERAQQRARQPLAGAFAGVPTFIKDNTELKGLPTRQGSRAVPATPADHDGEFTKQFLRQGVIPLGKSMLPEFGFSASTEFTSAPPTRNPWHTDYSAGASSGGSAALVAAGVVPIAHANDGGGSIRIPAAACGLIGLKPTRGRLVDGKAARSLPINIVTEGVLTRSVRDTVHFYAAAEKYFHNPKLPGIGLTTGPSSRRLRIGVVFDSVTGHATDADTRRTVTDTAALLTDLGHDVREMPQPVSARFANDFALYWCMLAFLVSMFGKKVFGPGFDASQIDNATRGMARQYRRHVLTTPLVFYRLYRIRHEYARFFRDYDIVLSPALAHTTPLLGYLSPEQPFDQLFERLRHYVSFTPLNNVSGGPAIVLPMGVTAEGLPIAAHFSAAHGDERTLLELAYELEAAHPWRRIQDAPAH